MAVAGSGDHEVGGMNDGNTAAGAGASVGSGLLIDVRFPTADMSESTHIQHK